MKRDIDLLMRAYGMRSGDRIGVMAGRHFDARRIAEVLDRLSCTHVLLDSSEGFRGLLSKIESNGLRLLFVPRESRAAAEKLPICIGIADAFLEKVSRLNGTNR